MRLTKLLLYFNTLRYLSFRQFVFNFIRRYFKNKKITIIFNAKCKQLTLLPPIEYVNKIDIESVIFLNKKRNFAYISDWTCLAESKLWRYNLHYFDFLLDNGATEKIKDKLITDWIKSSHNLKVDAWEPYPVSLRIVNWVKYFITYKKNNIPEEWLTSLYQQASILFGSIEYHILANHYLKNGKALFFAGAYLKGKNPTKWFDKGVNILVEEAAEQFLIDGGHYEKSPMYHSIVVEDYLDVLNLIYSNSVSVSECDSLFLKDQVMKALDFLNAIVMPDTNIPLFNDSAFEIAPHPDFIFKYANKIIKYNNKVTFSKSEIISLDHSGYYIIKNKKDMCVIDCGSVSPGYQPGHTHCDCLSYELVINGCRIIVNSGLYDYDNSEERKYCRSTKAHNTVEIDGKEQSEIWGQFRVARRAEIISARLYRNDNAAVFNGSYRPYWSTKDNIVHSRIITQVGNQWTVMDDITGQGEHQVKNFIHLHPQMKCVREDDEYYFLNAQNRVAKIIFSDNVDVSIVDGWYYPEFGKKIQNTVIELACSGKLPVKQEYIITVV